MNRHKKQQIKLECIQHKTLCYDYKNVVSLENVYACYAVIWWWWYSIRATNVVGLQKLEN